MANTRTSYRIEWRPKAREDLRAIIHDVEKEGVGKAYAFGQALRDRIEPLAQNPELGRAGRPGLPDYVRELAVDAHYIVFYRVLGQARIVEILRMKHAAQHAP